MGLSATHIIILLAVVVLLFGAGRVSALMGDVAKGMKSFKKGMAEDDEPAPAPRRLGDDRVVEQSPQAPAAEAAPAERGSASEADRR